MSFVDRVKMASSILAGTSGGASSGTLADLLRTKDGGGRGRTPQAMLAAYGELPWLHAVVGKVSFSVASNPWRLYRPTRQTSGSSAGRAHKLVQRSVERDGMGARRKTIARLKAEGEVEEVDDHPVLELIYGGNDFMTGSTVRQLNTAYQDVVGEAFQLIERNGRGAPEALLPIPRTWVKSIATPAEPFFEVDMDTYKEQVPASDMIYFQRPDLRNPYGRGVGTAGVLIDELNTDEMAAKHTAKWFTNSARPDILVYGKGLNPEETQRLERKWRQKFQGFKNSFEPAFFSNEIGVKELTQTFQSMQLKELRAFERDTIIQVYGVPPEILGIIENSNRSTIEAADYLYGKWVIQPRLEYDCEVWQVRLLDTEYGDGLILGYDSPVAEDKEYRLNTAKSAPWSLMVDEWREMMGFEPLPNGQGQVFMMPFNLVPQTSPSLAPDLPEAPPEEPAPDDEPADEPEEEPTDDENVEEESRGKAGGQVGPMHSYDEASEGRVSDAEEQHEFDLYNREDFGGADLHSYDGVQIWHPATTKQDEPEQPPLTDEDVVIIVSELSEEGLMEAMAPVLADVISEFGEGAAYEVDGEWVVSPRVQNYLSVRAAEKIRGINETTRDALRAALVEAVRAGEGIPAVRRRVEGLFEEARGFRATNIARTEIVGASNFGAWEGYRQNGVPGKEWLETADSDTRTSHEELGGQRVRTEEDFANSLGAGPCPGMMSGGASNNAQCRCTLLPVIDMEQDSVSGDVRKAMWRAFDRNRMPFERRMKGAVRGEFAKQRDQILALVEEHSRERAVV